jgi:hypothetical protein
MSANIKASVDGTQAIIGVGGVDQMTVSNAGVVTANSFVGAMSAGNISSATALATGSTTARTLANRFADVVNVKDFGAVGDGIADDTAAIQAALTAVPSGGSLFFPTGTYLGYLLIWRGDISILGSGSASTKIKLPNNCPSITVPWEPGGTITGLPNVIELGKCALGNIATDYSNVTIKGITIDGNYTNNTAPTTDLFGHGIIITKTSKCFIDDVIVQNCFLTGIDNVINSNYNSIKAKIINCGNAVVSGGNYPNFDINSSKYGQFDIISSGGYYGGRMLDNCWGNSLNITVYDSEFTGFVYNNQSVNQSYSNIINAMIIDGCNFGQGISIGSNCNNSQINATIRNVTGTGFWMGGASLASAPTGNTVNVNTYNCGTNGIYLNQYCQYNTFNIVSKQDGRSGGSGSSFAVDVDGADNNQFTVCIQEGTISQVRGFIFRSGSTNNHVIDLLFDPNLVQSINDLGTGNYINWPSGSPTSAIASSNTINIPFGGSLFEISGNTGIVGADTSNTYRGRVITLRFQSNPIIYHKTATPGENFILSGSVNFNATAGDTLTFITDGTDWIEIGRTVI